MAATIPKEELEVFTDYFNGFYGPEGLYPSKRTVTQDEIEKALDKRHWEWGAGDSVDRELVRDLIFSEDEMKEMYK